MAIQQDANRISCQVTVVVVVTGIDVSSTVTMPVGHVMDHKDEHLHQSIPTKSNTWHVPEHTLSSGLISTTRAATCGSAKDQKQNDLDDMMRKFFFLLLFLLSQIFSSANVT